MTNKPNTTAEREYPELPEPLEINWPELHSEALGCGVEDRGIRDRYEAAQYGWQDGVDKAVDCVPEKIFDADQMRTYVDADRASRAQAAQAVPDGYKLVPIEPTPEMIQAGYDAYGVADCYGSMLAAAPSAPAPEAALQELVNISQELGLYEDMASAPAALAAPAVAWQNGCDKTVPAALRFLADNDRPDGAQDLYNSWHLHQLADEIERVAKQTRAAPQPAAPQDMPVTWEAFHKAVDEYIDDYEMLGETEDGRDACYTPNENDRALLLDAFMGFDFTPWVGLAPQPQEAAPAAAWEIRTSASPASVEFTPFPGRAEEAKALGFEVHELVRRVAAPSQDTELLDWLKENTCDLRCVQTSEDDYDWVVIEHHMAEPHEREIGRSYSDDPREAICAARAQQEGK